jgi:hypothetical protein
MESASREHRIVVLAADPHVGKAVEKELHRGSPNGHTQVRVVVPALAKTRFEHAAGAVDEGIHEAEGRIEESTHEIEAELGDEVDVSATIGDSDPVLAIEDALREGPADEIVIVTHGEEDERLWLEADAFERARERFNVPVVHFQATAANGEVSVREAGRSSGDEATPAQSGEAANLPRFSTRDIIGMIVAVIGTIVLVVIAASGSGFSAEGGLSSAAVCVLIAGAAGLINLAHVVGILLFQSVGYTGSVERVFSNLSLWGTLAAIPIALIIQ